MMKNLFNSSTNVNRQSGKSYSSDLHSENNWILFSHINFLTMEKSYKSTGVSSPTPTERTLSLSKGVEVRTLSSLSPSKGSSSSFFKSFALALAMLVVGIGGVLGQAVSAYTPLITSGTYTTITGTSILGNVSHSL